MHTAPLCPAEIRALELAFVKARPIKLTVLQGELKRFAFAKTRGLEGTARQIRTVGLARCWRVSTMSLGR